MKVKRDWIMYGDRSGRNVHIKEIDGTGDVYERLFDT